MVNLLKFKERAEYADERETGLSGTDAYDLYRQDADKIVEKFGGIGLFRAACNGQIVGDGELPWDEIVIVQYPSIESFQEMLSSDSYEDIHVHRNVGLKHQVLINCRMPKEAAD